MALAYPLGVSLYTVELGGLGGLSLEAPSID